MDIETLIRAHTSGSAEALVESIERGEQKVKSWPVQPVVARPTPKDEQVASLFEGFRRLRSGR